MNIKIKVFLSILIMSIFMVNFAMAYEPAFRFSKEQSDANVTLQVLNNDNSPATLSSTCTLTVKDRDLIIRTNAEEMAYLGNGMFTLFVGDILDKLGQYSATLNCDDGSGTYLGSTFYFDVTETGDEFDSSQSIMVMAQVCIIALFLGLGFSFSKEKWKIRSLFFMASLLMGIITLNSIRIIAGTSTKLSSMGNIGLMLGIVIMAVMFLYILIFYTIEMFKYFQEKKRMRWEVGGRSY